MAAHHSRDHVTLFPSLLAPYQHRCPAVPRPPILVVFFSSFKFISLLISLWDDDRWWRDTTNTSNTSTTTTTTISMHQHASPGVPPPPNNVDDHYKHQGWWMGNRGLRHVCVLSPQVCFLFILLFLHHELRWELEAWVQSHLSQNL